MELIRSLGRRHTLRTPRTASVSVQKGTLPKQPDATTPRWVGARYATRKEAYCTGSRRIPSSRRPGAGRLELRLNSACPRGRETRCKLHGARATPAEADCSTSGGCGRDFARRKRRALAPRHGRQGTPACSQVSECTSGSALRPTSRLHVTLHSASFRISIAAPSVPGIAGASPRLSGTRWGKLRCLCNS